VVSYLCHLLLLFLAPSLAVAVKSCVFKGVPSEYLGSLWLRLALFPSPHRSSMNSLTYSPIMDALTETVGRVGQGSVRRKKNWVAKARVQWCGFVFFLGGFRWETRRDRRILRKARRCSSTRNHQVCFCKGICSSVLKQ